MKSPRANNQNIVLLLGVVHATNMRVSAQRKYLTNLHDLIVKLKPHVLCVELSEEQLKCKVSATSKGEYALSILPAATECGCTVVPIQPCHSEGLGLEMKKKQLFLHERTDPRLGQFNEFTSVVDRYLLEHVLEIAEQKDGIMRLQNPDIHKLLFETLWRVNHEYRPKAFQKLWQDWNKAMATKIASSVQGCRRNTVLVTVGLEHITILKSLLRQLLPHTVKELYDHLT